MRIQRSRRYRRKNTHKLKKNRKQTKTKIKNTKKARGIVRRRTDESNGRDFMAFLTNSFVSFFMDGSNGVTFVATLTKGIASPYISTDSDTYGNSVSKILVKLVFLHPDRVDQTVLSKRDGKPDKELRVTKEDIFVQEVNTQLCVYEKTKDFPICPAIVLASIIRNDKVNQFLDIVASRGETSSDAKMINEIKAQFTHNFSSLGVICMEFADGYGTLSSFRTIPEKTFLLYKAFSMYLLLELATKTSLTHGDFHFGNVMFNPSEMFLKEKNGGLINGKPLLIDFGYSTPIDDARLDEIKQHIANNNYLLALQVMCRQNRRDDAEINYFPEYYGWACGTNPFFKRGEADKHFYSIKRKIVKKYVEDYNAVNAKKITEADATADDDLDDTFGEQTADELAHAPIDMTDPKMIELNNIINTVFVLREEAKVMIADSLRTLSGVELPVPPTECRPLSMAELETEFI
jgi:hypothetical protein